MNTLRTSYKVWLYKSKINKKGENPIYFRLIVGENKTEISTGIHVFPQFFDGKSGRVINKHKDAEFLNFKIDTLVTSFQKQYKTLQEKEIPYTAEELKQRILGSHTELKGIAEYFEDYCNKLKKLIGVDYCFKTVERYGITLKYLKEFISKEYNTKDYLLVNLNIKFISGFDLFLKSEKKNNSNTAAKSISNLKAVVNKAITEGYISNNPFHGFKIKLSPPNIKFLNEAELAKIENKVFEIDRLELVRKIWLFQVYTGLAYIDMVKLNKDEIIIYNGKPWLNLYRTKTKIPVKVPLIARAIDILKEFKSDSNLVFPSLSNQKMNSYLKEIADICGITKKLSTHVARHTFATTITLACGVSVDVVSAMLGHSSLKSTQQYAKVVPIKIEREMMKIQ